MSAAVACILALALDLWIGDPGRGQSLMGFRRLAERVGTGWGTGFGGWLLLALAPAAVLAVVAYIPGAAFVLGVLTLFLSLGVASLLRAASDPGASSALAAPEVGGRPQWPAPVRLLHGAYAVVAGPLFWFLVGGPAAVLLYRLSMVLGELWAPAAGGPPQLGRAPALIAAVLGWLPARLAALTFIALGDSRRGWRAWREGPGVWSLDNGAVVAAVAAGAVVTPGEATVTDLGGPAPRRRAAQALKLAAAAWVVAVVVLAIL